MKTQSADIPSLIPVFTHQDWMSWGLAGVGGWQGARGELISESDSRLSAPRLDGGGDWGGGCVELISILEFFSVRPPFVKSTQLAQFNKISHAW